MHTAYNITRGKELHEIEKKKRECAHTYKMLHIITSIGKLYKPVTIS